MVRRLMRSSSSSAVAVVLALAACRSTPTTTTPTEGTAATAPAAPHYHASIRWTAYGVPHIVAADVGSLGFGQGYAMAKAHLCEIADVMVRVRGERARYLGAGPDDVHVDSDLANLHLGYHRRAEDSWSKLSAETRTMLEGFAAGYDHYLARTPVAQRAAACQGAAWLVPITGVDVAAYGLSVQSLASAHFL